MLAGMTHAEYVHWQAIYSTEPFPEERADQRTAELLRMMLITAGVKKLPNISDLMPDWWGERKPYVQSPEQIKANMNLIKAATKKKPQK
jgi:hypothetical protein